VLHFIPDEDDPHASVSAFCSQMAAGNFLAVSHITSDGTAPAVMATIRDAYRTASAPAVFRSREEIEGFFAGLDLVHPGLVEVSAWRASGSRRSTLRFLGGVGQKR
jgi:S-adenosyl methyltransferase